MNTTNCEYIVGGFKVKQYNEELTKDMLTELFNTNKTERLKSLYPTIEKTIIDKHIQLKEQLPPYTYDLVRNNIDLLLNGNLNKSAVKELVDELNTLSPVYNQLFIDNPDLYQYGSKQELYAIVNNEEIEKLSIEEIKSLLQNNPKNTVADKLAHIDKEAKIAYNNGKNPYSAILDTNENIDLSEKFEYNDLLASITTIISSQEDFNPLKVLFPNLENNRSTELLEGLKNNDEIAIEVVSELIKNNFTLQEKNTYDKDLRKKYFSNGEITTALEILEKISKSSHPLALLANKLVPFVKSNNVKIKLVQEIAPINNGIKPAGIYNAVTNHIEIVENARFRGLGSEVTILHEILHSLTYYELRTNSKLVQDFEVLYNHAKKSFKSYDISTQQGTYATLNKDEFIVALFTDGVFINELKNIKAIDFTSYKNMLEEILDLFFKLFKIDKKTNKSLFEQSFIVATNILTEAANNREFQQAIEDYNNSINEEYNELLPNFQIEDNLQTQQFSPVKPEIQKLFDSNPELANKIYETLGIKIDKKSSTNIVSTIYELMPNITEEKINEIYENYVGLMNKVRANKEISKEVFKNLLKQYQVFNYKNTYIFGHYDIQNGVFVTRINSSPSSKELLAEALPKLVSQNIHFVSFVPKDVADKYQRSGYSISKHGFKYNFKGENMIKYLAVSNPDIVSKIFNKNIDEVSSVEIENFNKQQQLKYIPVEIKGDLIEAAGKESSKIFETYLNQFGIIVKDIDIIKEQLNIDEVGFADILSKIAYVKNKKDLPPIAGEFIAYMMQYNPLIETIIDELIQTNVINIPKDSYETDQDGNKIYNYKTLNKTKFYKYIGKLIATDLQNKLEGNYKKSIVDKIKELIKTFYTYLANTQIDKINVNIGVITNNILQQNKKLITASLYKPSAYGKPTKQVSLQKAMDSDNFGASIINKLSKQGFILTGTTSLGEQGTVQRPDENLLHDIDWVSPFNRKQTEELFKEIYPNAIKIRDIYGEGYITDTWLIAPEGYKIANLQKISDYNVITSYDVIDNNDKIVGSYRLQKQEENNQNEEVVTGIAAKIIDFFSYNKYNQLAPFEKDGIKLANWKETFKAKLQFARYKDIWDYNRFIPNDNVYQITPQQKQQALQLYAQYLENNKQDIEELQSLIEEKERIEKEIADIEENVEIKSKDKSEGKGFKDFLSNTPLSKETKKVVDFALKKFTKIANNVEFINNQQIWDDTLGTEKDNYKGFYADNGKGKIIILLNPKTYNDETVIHEIIHAFTQVILDNPSTKEEIEYVKTIQKLFEEFKSIEGTSYDYSYIYEDIAEFITYTMTNTAFQEFLSENEKTKSIFEKFIEIIKNLFGFNSNNTVNKVIKATQNIINITDYSNLQQRVLENTSNKGQKNEKPNNLAQLNQQLTEVNKRINNIQSNNRFKDLQNSGNRDKIQDTLFQVKNIFNSVNEIESKLITINKTANSIGSNKNLEDVLKKAGLEYNLRKDFIQLLEDNKSLKSLKLSEVLSSYLKEFIKESDRQYYKAIDEPLSEELENILIKYFDKFHIRKQELDNLKEKFGVDSIGIFDVLAKTIYYSKNRNLLTLPEEYGHVFIELLGSIGNKKANNPLFKYLFDNIDFWDGYQRVYRDYKNIYVTAEGNTDIYKIKKEAIGQAIGIALVRNYKVHKGDKGFWSKIQKVIDYILNLIKGINYVSLNTTVDSIAKDILNSNYSKLDRLNKDTSNYNLLNYSETIKNQNKIDGGKALRFMQWFSQKGMLITGSLAYRLQGNVYRPEIDALHDIDNIVPSDVHGINLLKENFLTPEQLEQDKIYRKLIIEGNYKEAKKYKIQGNLKLNLEEQVEKIQILQDFKKEFPDTEFLYSFYNQKANAYYVTINAIWSENQELKNRFKSYSGSFNNRLEKFTKEELQQIYLFDFFLRPETTNEYKKIDDTEFGLSLAHFNYAFYEKLNMMGRPKDAFDYQMWDYADENNILAPDFNDRLTYFQIDKSKQINKKYTSVSPFVQALKKIFPKIRLLNKKNFEKELDLKLTQVRLGQYYTGDLQFNKENVSFANSLNNSPYKHLLDFNKVEDVWIAKVLSLPFKQEKQLKTKEDIDKHLKSVYTNLFKDDYLDRFIIKDFFFFFINFMVSEENEHEESREQFRQISENDDLRKQAVEQLQNEHKKNLLHYKLLIDSDNTYSLAFKINLFYSIIKENINVKEENGVIIYNKASRGKNTVKTFDELSEGIIANLNTLDYAKSSKSFLDNYIDYIENHKPDNENILKEASEFVHQKTEKGIWYKFDDPNNEKMVEVVSKLGSTTIGQLSSWCTANVSNAKNYISKGALYIYYSYEENIATIQINTDKRNEGVEIGGNNSGQALYDRDIDALDLFIKTNPKLNLKDLDNYNFYKKIVKDTKKGLTDINTDYSDAIIKKLLALKTYKKDNSGDLDKLKDKISNKTIAKIFNTTTDKIYRDVSILENNSFENLVFIGNDLNLKPYNQIDLNGFTFNGNNLNLGYKNQIKDLNGFTFDGNDLNLGKYNNIDLNGFTFNTNQKVVNYNPSNYTIIQEDDKYKFILNKEDKTNFNKIPFLKEIDNTIIGFYDKKTDEIVINQDVVNPDKTVYHELVHRFFNNLDKTSDLYQIIEPKIKELVDFIKSDKDLKEKIETQYQPDEINEELIAHYISDVISNKLNPIKNKTLSDKINDIINTVIDFIKNLSGLKELTNEQIKNLKVEEFADKLANTILKENSSIPSSTVNIETISDGDLRLNDDLYDTNFNGYRFESEKIIEESNSILIEDSKDFVKSIDISSDFENDKRDTIVTLIIKPLALLLNKEQMINDFIKDYADIIEEEEVFVDSYKISQHYSQFKNESFFTDLVEYYTGKKVKVYKLKINKDNISNLRKQIGHASDFVNDQTTLRYKLVGEKYYEIKTKFGVIDNGIHFSSDQKEGLREANIWFGIPKIFTNNLEAVKIHKYLYTQLRKIDNSVSFSGGTLDGTEISSKLTDLDYRIMSNDIYETTERIKKEIPNVKFDKEDIDAASGNKYIKLEYEFEGGKADIAIVPFEGYLGRVSVNHLAALMSDTWKIRTSVEKEKYYQLYLKDKEIFGKDSKEALFAKENYAAIKENFKRQVNEWFRTSKIKRDIREQYTIAEIGNKEFNSFLDNISENFDENTVKVVKAPLKSISSLKLKADLKYIGRVYKATDIVRATLIINNAENEEILNFVFTNLKNKFAQFTVNNYFKYPKLGYKGINISILTNEDGVIELQINTPSMIYLKENKETALTILGDKLYNKIDKKYNSIGGKGHIIYDEIKKAKLAKNTELIKKLEQQSIDYYTNKIDFILNPTSSPEIKTDVSLNKLLPILKNGAIQQVEKNSANFATKVINFNRNKHLLSNEIVTNEKSEIPNCI